MSRDGGKAALPMFCGEGECFQGRRVRSSRGAALLTPMIPGRTPSRFRFAAWSGALGLCVTACVAVACGQSSQSSNATSSIDEAIVGGTLDRTTTGVVALVLPQPPQYVEYCSGSLIAPNLVMTARHCVANIEDDPNEEIQCGVAQFSAPYDGSQFSFSADAVRPASLRDPSFVQGAEVRVPPTGTEFCGNDVALVILAGKGFSSSEAAPLVPRLDIPPSLDEVFASDGYGLTDPNTTDTDGQRMRASGNSVTCVGTDCRSENPLVGASEWLSLDAQICPGDSGGPALDANGRVMGVASRGADGCSAAIYGNVSSWKAFIISTAKDAAQMGGYDAPSWVSDSTAPATSGASGVDAGSLVPPFGESCSAPCADDYACYSDSGDPPGICVPRCSAVDTTCPIGYACAAQLQVCAPNGSAALPHESSGCDIGARGDASNGALALALGLGFVTRRRRRGAVR